MGSFGAGTRQQHVRLGAEPRRDEVDLARLTARIVALTGRGEFAALDTELSASAGVEDGRGRGALWSGMRALVAGQLGTCERMALAAIAAAERSGDDEAAATEAGAGLLLVLLRREQERPAEAEVILRELLLRHPSRLAVRVTWASLLGDLGRDAKARAELRSLATDDFVEVREDPGWLPALCQLGELAVLVNREAEAAVLYRQLEPYAWRFAVDPLGAACHGSVSLYLGILAHGLGRGDHARRHFVDALEAHRAAGAPILTAHTQRRLATLLRTHGDDDDWDRAIELLSEAESTYTRLGIDGRAAEAQALLARSLDAPPTVAGSANEWRREGEGWLVRFAGRTATLPDSRGLRDLTLLVSHSGQSFHVADLWMGTGRGVGRAGSGPSGLGRRPGGVAIPLEHPIAPTLDDQTRAECRARLAELESELTDAERDGDPLAASLAQAEREAIAAELASTPSDEDPTARIRRLVALRLRRAVERVADAHPELGRHLRHTVRTGTFCAYEPPPGTTWAP